MPERQKSCWKEDRSASARLDFTAIRSSIRKHRKTLEQVIRTAGRFGADHVSTFAGAFEDRPVEESFAEFGKVFRELADLAKENGVKLGIENCLMDGTWEKATCNIGFHPRAWRQCLKR